MAKIKARINPTFKSCLSHVRCGFAFTQEYQEIDADDATVAELQAEQLLEVIAISPTEELPPADDLTVRPEPVEGKAAPKGKK